MNPHPSLTVVAGRPGAGKSTLAQALAKAIRCPAISRDQIKEGIVNALSPGSARTDAIDTIQRHANDVFFKTIELLLQHGVTLVAEAAFQHKVWAPLLEPLLARARARIILCTVDAALAQSRHIGRGLADPEREAFHGDDTMQAAREGRRVPVGSYDPPRFDVPTLVVDTTDGYRPQFDAIVSFVHGTKSK